jgi:hypothetical protein
MQNSQRASENAIPFSMQSTPAPQEPYTEESVWDIWPYCWAIDGWDIACENFENQRANFAAWKLARFNRRAQEKFCRKNWSARFLSHWHHTAESDERDLKLV